jgi:hypothetical protein
MASFNPIPSPHPHPPSTPTLQFQEQLRNLSKKDSLWNGFLVVKDDSLVKVNIFEYLGRKVIGKSTSQDDLEKAVVNYITNNKGKITSENIKMASKLAKNIGLSQNEKIKDIINEIFWKNFKIENLQVPDIVAKNPAINKQPETKNQEFISPEHHLLSNENFAKLTEELKTFDKTDEPILEKKFQNLLKTNSNEAKILAISCLQRTTNAGIAVIKNAFLALLEVNPLHAMEFAKELAKKNTIYTTEFRDLLNTLRPEFPDIAKELAAYITAPYSATFNEKQAAQIYLEKKGKNI